MTDAKQLIAWRHVLCLLLSLAMVAAPHAAHLPWWIIALDGDARSRGAPTSATPASPLPNRWLLILDRARRHRRRLFQLPDHLRPRRRRGAAGGHAGTEAAGDAHAARRDAAHLPRLLPGDHQFPLLADHPAPRSTCSRAPGCITATMMSLQLRAGRAAVPRPAAHRRHAARPVGAADAGAVPAVPARARARCGACRRTPSPA